MRALLLSMAALLGASGCGHLVTGVSSVPYLDPPGPVLTEADRRNPRIGIPQGRLHLSGVDLLVNLWNDVYTSKPEARLFNRSGEASHNFLVQVIPVVAGVSLSPQALRLLVDGEVRPLLALEVRELDLEAGRSQAPWRPWPLQAPPAPLILAPGHSASLMVHVALPRPRPEQDLVLDLGEALRVPGGGPLPRVRFRRVVWEEMHQ